MAFCKDIPDGLLAFASASETSSRKCGDARNIEYNTTALSQLLNLVQDISLSLPYFFDTMACNICLKILFKKKGAECKAYATLFNGASRD